MGDGNALNLDDDEFGMSSESGDLANTLRGLRMCVLVTEPIQGGGTDNQMHCANQQPAAGGEQDLLINGNDAVDGVGIQRFCGRVSITSSGVDNGRLFTIFGRDANGRPQAEEITGPNATTVEGLKGFTKIDRVIVDDDTAGTVSVGQLETGPRHLRRKGQPWGIGAITRSNVHLAIEGNTLVTTGTFQNGTSTTQTATNADQRAKYTPVALTDDIEVTYLADLRKEGMGENYTDSRQATFSAI